MGPADYRAARARTAWPRREKHNEKHKWLGEEGSNPHYQGQNLASYH